MLHFLQNATIWRVRGPSDGEVSITKKFLSFFILSLLNAHNNSLYPIIPIVEYLEKCDGGWRWLSNSIRSQQATVAAAITVAPFSALSISRIVPRAFHQARPTAYNSFRFVLPGMHFLINISRTYLWDCRRWILMPIQGEPLSSLFVRRESVGLVLLLFWEELLPGCFIEKITRIITVTICEAFAQLLGQ